MGFDIGPIAVGGLDPFVFRPVAFEPGPVPVPSAPFSYDPWATSIHYYTYGIPAAFANYTRIGPGPFGVASTPAALLTLTAADSPIGVAQWRMMNDFSGYRGDPVPPGGGAAASVPGLGERVNKLFDTVVVNQQDPTKAFSPEERRAILDSEKRSALAGQHQLLVQLTKQIGEWMRDPARRGEFVTAHAKLYDGKPNEEARKRRIVMNLIDPGATKPNDRLDALIVDLLPRAALPREKGKDGFAYVDALVGEIEKKLGGELLRLDTYAVQRARAPG